MKRRDVIGPLLALYDAPRYLEIGVEAGTTFHAVAAARKVAVDPDFRFVVPEPRITPTVAYHQTTSDDYFGRLIDEDDRFDVIFLDGLHTSEQTLRDLLNAVGHLAPGGVIVIDDTMPNSYAASMRSPDDLMLLRSRISYEQENLAWMGDVFRIAFFVETFLQAFSFATIEEAPGQMILWRGRRPGVVDPGRTLAWVGGLELAGLHRNLADLRPMPLADIVEACRTQRAKAADKP